ncbi:hypothetical protein UWK_00833 [Desulfocapsa sulfexigens DSM 10523]|uniref:Uncharacterized protein n=1 Tax=Desulfocapsa sulfexigens (strain DSM 10523 / SB164P1) TaxID=1167006 RepID=M1P6T3_DESSD|nr:hypothetical protein [Desulfocapsa sulfexigens]AGF77407.1 hypothetical protein UWK_00833 [Desulfocapsa sulfexigens DSM 10523]
MGDFYLDAGKEARVGYTFNGNFIEDGGLKISLHHSFLPFTK